MSFTFENKYDFPLIPDEFVDSVFTTADRNNAQVWYGPTVDGDLFYYSTFVSNFILASLGIGFPSVLVCRRVADGSHVWSKNCNIYNLDPNPVNPVMSRNAPLIVGDSLYITSGVVSRIGPQLYCIDKATGDLTWAVAYDPPVGSWFTSKDEAEAHAGPNLRMSNLNLALWNDRIIAGESSFQNTFLNLGVLSGGYPFFTDRGGLFVINQQGHVEDQYFFTPEPYSIGDTVVASTNPMWNPFLPGKNYTVIGTTSVGSPSDVYLFPADELPLESPGLTPGMTPIAVVIRVTPTTVIGPDLFTQAIWSHVDMYSLNSDRATIYYSQAGVLAQMSVPANGVNTYMVWAWLSDYQIAELIANPSNSGLFYYKKITPGAVLSNKYDANAMSYWGISSWGAAPVIVGDTLFVGTGQLHGGPFYEGYLYARNPESVINLKRDLVRLENSYIANPTRAGLSALNNFKEFYADILIRDSTLLPRSPRLGLALNNAVVRINLVTSTVEFATRTIPYDLFTFDNSTSATDISSDPVVSTVGSINIVDNDVSCGIFFSGEKLITVTKNGIGIGLNKKTGEYLQCKYISPCATLGGSNYQAAQYCSDRRSLENPSDHIIGIHANTPDLGYEFEPDLIETMITEDGVIIPHNNSFEASYNADNTIDWITSLGVRALALTTIIDGKVFICDTVGNLYAIDPQTGEVITKYDNSPKTHGGVSAPHEAGELIIWTPSYIAPRGFGGAGAKLGSAFSRMPHSPCGMWAYERGIFRDKKCRVTQHWWYRNKSHVAMQCLEFWVRISDDLVCTTTDPCVKVEEFTVIDCDSYSWVLVRGSKRTKITFHRK